MTGGPADAVDVRLPSGLRVVAVSRPGPPTVALRLVVPLPGLARDARDGLDALVRRIMDGPDPVTGGPTLRRRLADRGATGEAAVEGGVLTVALSVLADGLAAVLPVLAAAVTDIGLTAAAIHPGRVRRAGRPTADAELEDIVLARRFPGRLDGPASGTAARVVPDGAALVLVGTAAADRLAGCAGDAFAAWTGRAPAAAHTRPVPAGPSGDVVVVRRDEPSGSVLLAGPGLPLGHPDALVARVAGLVLAGPVSARLGHELRDRRGVAYGVSLEHRHDPEGDWDALRVSCAADGLEAVLDGTWEVLTALAEDGAAPDEVAAARELAAATPALATAGQSALAAALAGFVAAGADPDDLVRARARALAVTGADVHRYCAETLRPALFDGAAVVPPGCPAGAGAGRWRVVARDPAPATTTAG